MIRVYLKTETEHINLYRIANNFVLTEKYPFIQYQTLDSELEYLRKEIYGRDMNLPIDPITPFNRFSERIGVS